MNPDRLTRREWIQLAAMTGVAAAHESAPHASAQSQPSQTAHVEADHLLEVFHNPPPHARPSCYWVWLNNYTDPERLSHELSEFKAKGLSGAYIFDIGARDPEGIVPAGPAYMSPESLSVIGSVVREAGRLGLEMGMLTSSSWNSGGPWIGPEHAGKGLYLSQLAVEGPGRKTLQLPMPDFPGKAPRGADGLPLYWKDVAVLAVPEKRQAGHKFLLELAPPAPHTVNRVVLYNTESEDPQRYGRLHLFAKDFTFALSNTTTDPGAFQEVVRGSLQPNTSAQEFRFAPREARYVKLTILSGHNPDHERVELGELEVYSTQGRNVAALRHPDGSRTAARLLHFSSQLGHESLGEPPDWTAQNIHDGAHSGARGSWSSAGPPPVLLEDRNSIVNLTQNLSEGGRLEWEVPAGRWVIFRFVSSVTGQQLVLPSPKSQGYAIDHFSAEATRTHIRYFGDKLRKELGDLKQTAMKQLYSASYELRGSIWTPDFLEQFQRRRGYDMLPFLPALFGSQVESHEVTERFLYDHQKTLGELLVDAYYRTGTETAHEYGLLFAAEAGGPGPPLHQVPVDALQAQGAIDIPRGEFWKEHNVWVVKETAAAAHIYGKRIVQMEAFTSFRHWLEGPFALKDIADRAFCGGANHFVFHTSPHNPRDAGLPGWVYGAGTHFAPSLVWWPMAKPFVDYLARTSALLQEGLFVADVCYYYGDQGFNFVPAKHVDPALGPGYDYDVVNAEVILDRMSVQQGRFTLPDGMSYELLVLPEREDIDWRVLQKLERLVQGGGTVVGPKPIRATGLRDYPHSDRQVRELASTMWGPCDGQTIKENRYGSGKVVWGRTLREVLQERGFGPQFHSSNDDGTADIDFIHRRIGEVEVFYLWNRRLEWQQADCRFRAKGRAPDVWNPVTGETFKPAIFRAEGDDVHLKLRFAPGGSLFVLFRTKIEDAEEHWTSLDGQSTQPAPPLIRSGVLPGLELHREDGSFRARGYSAGRYSGRTNRGRAVEVAIPEVAPPQMVEGPWEVRFAEGWGAPAVVQFPELISWTESQEEGVKFFSGIATYGKEFELSQELFGAGKVLYLDLGKVQVAADIHLNDRPMGIVWAPPYRVEITAVAKPGLNRLVVQVANTWANRLTGDLALPKEKRYTKTNIDWARRSGAPEPPLLESGLLGPVQIISAYDTTVG